MGAAGLLSTMRRATRLVRTEAAALNMDTAAIQMLTVWLLMDAFLVALQHPQLHQSHLQHHPLLFSLRQHPV